jgi:hypothetical protein
VETKNARPLASHFSLTEFLYFVYLSTTNGNLVLEAVKIVVAKKADGAV